MSIIHTQAVPDDQDESDFDQMSDAQADRQAERIERRLGNAKVSLCGGYVMVQYVVYVSGVDQLRCNDVPYTMCVLWNSVCKRVVAVLKGKRPCAIG